MTTNDKRGFWASLFAKKPCKCTCEAGGLRPVSTAREAAVPADSAGVRVVKVLGPGCAKCKSTLAVVEKAVHESGASVRVEKVDDIGEIMRYNVMATPAIVVDDVVVMRGKVPTEAEVIRLLGL